MAEERQPQHNKNGGQTKFVIDRQYFGFYPIIVITNNPIRVIIQSE